MKNLLFSLLFILAGNMAAGQSWYNLRNGADGLNALGVIFTTCTDDTGNVYAAGNFPENPDSANSKICVARWSAIRLRWERLGEGAAGINVERTIETMCVDKAGNVYAAGGFRDGPFSFSGYFYVARWDGHSWAKLGTGDSALKANRHISSLATDDSGNIYAAGYFLNIYGFCYVAKWSVVTLTWSELGHLSANEIIQSIVVDDSFNVYATGTFTDWQHHPYVAKYSPVTDTWISLGSGFAVPHKFIYKTLLALDTFNHLYVAIDGTDSASFDDSSWIYKWVGTNMVSLGGHAGFKGNTFSVKNDDTGNVYIAGDYKDNTGGLCVLKYSASQGWHELGRLHGTSMWDNPAIATLSLDKYNNVYAGGTISDDSIYMSIACYGIPPATLNITNINTSNIFSFYPNPAHDVLYLSGGQQQHAYNIYNCLGQLVGEGELQSNDPIPVDIRTLAAGVYFLGCGGRCERFVKY